ncbi:MAG: hypothetical protein JW918_18075 [Anaerolineae bacterium]|nr:hypothetical protein [Anaerolineae bacterium]
MDEVHLREIEMACSKDEFEADAADHLRWCARCRSLAAEYRWLDERLADALASVSENVPVVRPGWRAIKQRIVAGRQRRIAGWRVSAIVGVALVSCILLLVSSVVGATVAAQLASPEAVVTPIAAVTAVASEGPAASWATSTPIVPHVGVEAPSASLLVPIPTPSAPSDIEL